MRFRDTVLAVHAGFTVDSSVTSVTGLEIVDLPEVPLAANRHPPGRHGHRRRRHLRAHPRLGQRSRRSAPSRATTRSPRRRCVARCRDDYGLTEAFRFYGGPIDDETDGPKDSSTPGRWTRPTSTTSKATRRRDHQRPRRLPHHRRDRADRAERGRRRDQHLHRLARHRVPAVGPGPDRRRPGRSPRLRLRRRRRTPIGEPPTCRPSPTCSSRISPTSSTPGRRTRPTTTAPSSLRSNRRGADPNHHRHRRAEPWRACGRADERRLRDAVAGGRALVLLRQHHRRPRRQRHRYRERVDRRLPGRCRPRSARRHRFRSTPTWPRSCGPRSRRASRAVQRSRRRSTSTCARASPTRTRGGPASWPRSSSRSPDADDRRRRRCARPPDQHHPDVPGLRGDLGALGRAVGCSSGRSCGLGDGRGAGGRARWDHPRRRHRPERFRASAAPTLSDAERRAFEIGDSFFTQNWVIAPASTDARDGLGPALQRTGLFVVSPPRRAWPAGPTDGDAELGLLLRLSVPGPTSTAAHWPTRATAASSRTGRILGVAAEGRLIIDLRASAGHLRRRHPLHAPRADLRDRRSRVRRPAGRHHDLASAGTPDDRHGPARGDPEADILAAPTPTTRRGRHLGSSRTRCGTPRTGEPSWAGSAGRRTRRQSSSRPPEPSTATSASRRRVHPTRTARSAARLRAAPRGGEPEITDERSPASCSTHDPRGSRHARRRRSEVADGRRGCSTSSAARPATPRRTPRAPTDIAALANQTIHPYTDLLLHDMGKGLADGRPDFRADGNEWRTPPLWGLGLIDDVNGQRFLLHDGRARTIEEAVLWHAGEAEASKEAFRTAAIGLRHDLLAFLEAL